MVSRARKPCQAEQLATLNDSISSGCMVSWHAKTGEWMEIEAVEAE
jgi:hypothetical protein